MDTDRTLGTVGERARIVTQAKPLDLTERKDEVLGKRESLQDQKFAEPVLLRSQVRTRMPGGWWRKHKPLLGLFLTGKCTVEQVLDTAQRETGFRPSVAALGTAVTDLKRSMSLTSHQALAITPEQVRKAHAMATKIAQDVFDFEQETIRAVNELAAYIASLEKKSS